MKEKLGAPNTKVAMLLAVGAAKTPEEAQRIIQAGGFDEAIRRMSNKSPNEKVASYDRLQEQMKHTMED